MEVVLTFFFFFWSPVSVHASFDLSQVAQAGFSEALSRGCTGAQTGRRFYCSHVISGAILGELPGVFLALSAAFSKRRALAWSSGCDGECWL